MAMKRTAGAALSLAMALLGPACSAQQGAGVADPSVPKPAAATVQVNREAIVAALQNLGVKLSVNDQGVIQDAEAIKSRLDDAAMAELGRLTELEALDISRSPVTDAGLVHLKGLTNLRRLYLRDLKLTDDALANLKDLTGLEVLSLSKTTITGRGLVYVKKLAKLETLNLGKNPIDDDTLAQLRGLGALETLVLNETKVTGAGLVYLKPLTNLRVLNIEQCEVTDKQLMNLVGLTNLRMLHVNGCNVSQSGVTKFKNHMVSLAVYY
jgi:hypothetical protein